MKLTIHHLNCATLCPLGKKLFCGHGKVFERIKLVCHCLLIEASDSLILVDTGLGYRDILHTNRYRDLFSRLAHPLLLPEETAIEQIKAMGFDPLDVRHIILTHLDPDHAGGLADFPHAQVHLLKDEYVTATQPPTFREKLRYNPAQWSHEPNWKLHSSEDEQWFGFKKIAVINDRWGDIMLIPMIGHTRGHCGVAVSTPEGWILHAGDAYIMRSELVNAKRGQTGKQDVPKAVSNLWLKAFNHADSFSNSARLHNLRKLHALMTENSTISDIFCSHDPDEFHYCRQHAVNAFTST